MEKHESVSGTPEAAAKTTAAKKTVAAKVPVVPQLFIARVSSLGSTTLRKGEIAVDGAAILKTHGHLFDPLPITYLA